MKPTVSVIIPCYKTAATLPEAIETALNQTHPAVEVIVINDGSPDDTDRAVQPYLGRIRYLKQENRGLSAARNSAFRTSKGDFICFLDADDLLLPRKFELQLAKFKNEPELGVVLSGYFDVDADGTTIIQQVKKDWGPDALERLLNHEVFPPHVPLIRREVLERSSLFPENIDTGESQEDWQLWLDLALDGVRFGSVPEPTCMYRRNRQGSISSNLLKHNDGARRVVRWLQDDPRAKKYVGQIEHLAAIVEMERVARAWQCGLKEEAQNVLLTELSARRGFWLEPHNYHILFLRSCPISEYAEWNRSKDVSIFRQRILEILQLAEGRVAAGELQDVMAAAELACSNLAYECGDSRMRRLSVFSAIRNSPFYAFRDGALRSTIKGLVGHKVGRYLQVLAAR